MSFEDFDYGPDIGSDFEQMPAYNSFDFGNFANPADFASLTDMLKGGDLPAEDTNVGDLLNYFSQSPDSNFDMSKFVDSIGGDGNADWENYGFADIGVGDVGTSGYYDEETGKFVPSAYGQLQAPLDEKSGTNLNSMDGYTYDKNTGTWTTPDGKTYTPDVKPSGTAKSGAQVMVDSGALPKGYGGLNPTAGSTADKTVTPGGGDPKITTPGGTNPAGTKSGMDPMAMMMLMLMLSQMGKGGGGSSAASVIPTLTADRKQLPYSAPSRPGAGGVNYFSPNTYTKQAAAGGMMGYAGGGGISSLGSYSDGGRLLKGPGDGVSDNIPATIAGKQPARLANGEFVVPARIVSELGNGSTDAGAKRLYEMMDRVQKARRKTKNVAADTKAHKYLPA